MSKIKVQSFKAQKTKHITSGMFAELMLTSWYCLTNVRFWVVGSLIVQPFPFCDRVLVPSLVRRADLNEVWLGHYQLSPRSEMQNWSYPLTFELAALCVNIKAVQQCLRFPSVCFSNNAFTRIAGLHAKAWEKLCFFCFKVPLVLWLTHKHDESFVAGKRFCRQNFCSPVIKY